MTPIEQRAFTILQRLPPAAVVAEVGVLIGGLSERLLKARTDLRLVMVDNWAPATQQPLDYRKTRDTHAGHDAGRVAKHREQAEAVAARYPGRALIVPLASRQAASFFGPEAFDLVFLDADHSESGVRADIEAWGNKVRPGGWLGGHDYGNADDRYDFSGVARAVDAAFPSRMLDQNFTWWVRL